MAPASTQAPAFQAASIHPSPTGVGGPVGASFDVRAGGWMLATGATLHDFVARAYGVQYFQVVGGDRWISSERFDLNACGQIEATSKDRQLMLRTLLQERFDLRVHTETRNLPVFALVVASRGRTGPQLRTSQHDCRRVLEDRDPFEAAHEDTDRPECRPTTRFVVGGNASEITLIRAGTSMSQLAAQLASFAQRPVLDRTGLEGTYDIELAFSPDTALFVTEDGIRTAPRTDGLSLATAVREQLGLKLDSTHGPSEVVVIDAARRPSAE